MDGLSRKPFVPIVNLSLREELCQWLLRVVRELVASNAAFDDGYIFVGHSQGGLISRAVIEEMNDHKVKR
ncbi:hypothetical protein PsorP6_013801 [Peronosclerospora sorghi]|uniref:Uncharacterized protein n=1 Tax=Peronosclerospora sorghi TaxID=230839 RepID=A0ACC0VIK5_9STRA|nr:hypothetical protein PsorP6_013801 [Peronosclerospora sorghi]